VELSERLPRPLRTGITTVLQLGPVRFIRTMVMEIGSDDVPGLAAEMAYRFLFALFPFLIFLAALIGFIGARVGRENLFENVMGFIGNLVPPPVLSILDSWVAGVINTQSPGLLTVGALGALWGAAGGVGTLVKGLNRAYDVKENRPFWQAQLMALATTVALAFMSISGTLLYTFGGWLGGQLAEWFGLSGEFVAIWSRAYGPVVALGLWLVLLALYSVLPNQRIQLRHALVGATFATAAWVGLTVGFGFYLSHFGNFDKTFGSLGAPVVLMFWMYAVGMILLIGGEVNAILSGLKHDAATQEAEAAA
jgi:membrane protein